MAEPVTSEVIGEFASGWPVVLGAWIGVALGVAAVPALAISVFMRSMQSDLGWTRAQISLGLTILVGTTALVSPAVGWFADRVRASWICGAGLCALAISLFLFSRIGADPRLYYVACAGLALVASGAGTVPYAQAVSASFAKARGLALGIAMTGIGVSFVLAPMLLAPYAARVGWRQGYVTLAVIVAVAAPVVGLLMSRQPTLKARRPDVRETAGVSFEAAVRDPAFWILAVCFILIPLAVGGMQLHLISFLGDAGVNAATAGLIASTAGLTQIASRLLSGWLVDRIFAPRVAAAIMSLAGACIAGVAVFGAPAAPLAPIAFGLAMGAEIDLVGYMTARYFGMRAYGRVYGVLYASTTVGASLSPLFYGAVFDATKSYAPALYPAAGMLLLSAVLFLTLRRFEPADGSDS